jgi:hypothetical protein
MDEHAVQVQRVGVVGLAQQDLAVQLGRRSELAHLM